MKTKIVVEGRLRRDTTMDGYAEFSWGDNLYMNRLDSFIVRELLWDEYGGPFAEWLKVWNGFDRHLRITVEVVNAECG